MQLCIQCIYIYYVCTHWLVLVLRCAVLPATLQAIIIIGSTALVLGSGDLVYDVHHTSYIIVKGLATM